MIINKEKRKILVVLVDRANYGRMRMVMKAIDEHEKLELMVMCTGTMVLERFGSTCMEVMEDGFDVHSKIFMELEGGIPLTMAKSVGFGMVEFAGEYNRLQPDLILLIGDRYEALAAGIAAAYMNIPLAHIQGGEVSGSIDESARHAISKFAQFHFPATERAAEYLYKMGERRDTIFNVGCPVGDYILNLDDTLPQDIFYAGSGADIDIASGFNMVIFHPVTTEFGREVEQAQHLLAALESFQYPTIFLWPNIDAGADHISKYLRVYRERNSPRWLRFMKHIPPVNYQKALKHCSVAIGNSSSFVRDSTFTGTPVVLVGDRQKGREVGWNVISVPAEKQEIEKAVQYQINHGRYQRDPVYGGGKSGKMIAEILSHVELYIQKRLDYVNREAS